MSAKPFYPQYCSKCMRPIVVSWPPTEHKCEPPQDLSWALPPDTIQIPLAEYEKLKADAERLDALESNLWFVEPQYQYESPKYKVGKAEYGAIAGTLRTAIDAAIKQEGGAR